MSSNISSVPFFLLFQVFLLPISFNFGSFPTVLGYSVPFFQSIFFSIFCEDSVDIRFWESSYYCVHKYHKCIKDIVHSCYSVSIWFFLRMSIFLFTLLNYSCVLSNFSITDLCILIIVILNSFSDISNILFIFVCGPDVCSVS